MVVSEATLVRKNGGGSGSRTHTFPLMEDVLSIKLPRQKVVQGEGFEPPTSVLNERRSFSLSKDPETGPTELPLQKMDSVEYVRKMSLCLAWSSHIELFQGEN